MNNSCGKLCGKCGKPPTKAAVSDPATVENGVESVNNLSDSLNPAPKPAKMRLRRVPGLSRGAKTTKFQTIGALRYVLGR